MRKTRFPTNLMFHPEWERCRSGEEFQSKMFSVRAKSAMCQAIRISSRHIGTQTLTNTSGCCVCVWGGSALKETDPSSPSFNMSPSVSVFDQEWSGSLSTRRRTGASFTFPSGGRKASSLAFPVDIWPQALRSSPNQSHNTRQRIHTFPLY